MPKDATPLARLSKNQLENEYPFIWLYRITLPAFETAPYEQLRLTNFGQRVTFGTDDSGARLIWYPAPITNGGVKQTSEGDLPSITLSVGATGYDLMTKVDRRAGLIGYECELRLVHINELADPDAGQSVIASIQGCNASGNGVSLTVSSANLTRSQFPRLIYSRRRCRNIFGDEVCGYDLDAPNAGFTACSGTLTECIDRGEDEFSRGLPRRHPQRHRAFPGIARR